mgnify:CR=1 FL=1
MAWARSASSGHLLAGLGAQHTDDVVLQRSSLTTARPLPLRHQIERAVVLATVEPDGRRARRRKPTRSAAPSSSTLPLPAVARTTAARRGARGYRARRPRCRCRAARPMRAASTTATRIVPDAAAVAATPRITSSERTEAAVARLTDDPISHNTSVRTTLRTMEVPSGK